MGLLDRFLWVDLGKVVLELRGRGSRVPRLTELRENVAVFAQTNEANEVIDGGLSYPVRVRDGQVNVAELRDAFRRIGWWGL